MSEFKEVSFEECMEHVKTYIHNSDSLEKIQEAYEFASEVHKTQKRKSGAPYITHCIQVADTLALIHCGPRTIEAGLLHDTVEDCEGVTYDTIKEKFGEEVAEMVEAVTKVGKIKFQDEEDYQASNHRKLFIAMAKDVRVIYIKLADRLHNMRTLQYMKPEKQQRISKETLSVYAPIAHRLGMNEIKSELEDLSFKYLKPREYENIKELVQTRVSERNEQVQMMIKDIQTILNSYHIPYRIFGRSKHFYSIYKKMINKNKRFEEILDLYAIRIITDTVTHCYEILGYIHATYRPIPGRFKDYIAMPKANLYQSLHTTIVEPTHGNIFEVQIRTEEMDEVAERGVAAHWKYKENSNFNHQTRQKDIEDSLAWFRDFSQMTDEESEDAKEYMSVLQKDIFEANVYCLTPRGRVITLPPGSCPIDFAYRIHTDVGHKTVGAKVNGAIVPLNTKLNNGDVVEILTNKNSPGPSPDWIKIVRSGHARNKIRSFLQKKNREEQKEMIKQGEQMLKEEISRRNLDEKLIEPQRLETIIGSLSYKTLDDFYIGLANKRVSMQAVMDRIDTTKAKAMEDDDIIKLYNKPNANRKKSETGVIVPGIDTIAVSLANCCQPIPGDEIVGFISQGHGVKVHRKDCPNVAHETKRLIPVQWEDDLEEKHYEAQLVIHSDDRNYLLSDIVTVIQQCNVNLRHVDSGVDTNSLTATTKLTVGVKNAAHLQNLMANLKKVRSVRDVIRVIQ